MVRDTVSEEDSMSNSFSGSSGPRTSLLAAILGTAFASYAAASDRNRDADGISVAALEQRASDYLDFEGRAIHCRDGPPLLDRFDGTEFPFDLFVSKQLVSLRDGGSQWRGKCVGWLALDS